MKWVKCINISMLLGGCSTKRLTVGKIYAIKGFDSYEILIKSDDAVERWYSLERFQDATAEVREQLINKILNE